MYFNYKSYKGNFKKQKPFLKKTHSWRDAHTVIEAATTQQPNHDLKEKKCQRWNERYHILKKK